MNKKQWSYFWIGFTSVFDLTGKNTRRKFAALRNGIKPGDVVCDCRFKHLKVLTVHPDGDTVTLEDGANCSIQHCLDNADHKWQHPIGY
jgi:hypothetical protein